MAERPILFNGEMVRTILDGRKTQTRRVVKPQPDFAFEPRWMLGPGHSGEGWYCSEAEYPDEGSVHYRCPYGQPGDRLWVREAFCVVDDRDHGGKRWIDYRATPRYSADHPAGWDNAPDDPQALKWRPSIHMPCWASRITLEVTGVWVERVQDIDNADAKGEGVKLDASSSYFCDSSINPGPYVIEFRKLWDSINAKRGYSWDSNPWVWVVEFKRVSP